MRFSQIQRHKAPFDVPVNRLQQAGASVSAPRRLGTGNVVEEGIGNRDRLTKYPPTTFGGVCIRTAGADSGS